MIVKSPDSCLKNTTGKKAEVAKPFQLESERSL